ncbi:uncharacterized protein LOC106674321 isoform X1 [Cimex lectularius]|uniref:Uncharacterized protein n=2 Tax=Cimex lectularius TaxID=79782 RepID=A0A8I6SEM8_CIMLE|nr:uncharacterized protein LOC106674321 isoform X1 [Cimex lectularius]
MAESDCKQWKTYLRILCQMQRFGLKFLHIFSSLTRCTRHKNKGKKYIKTVLPSCIRADRMSRKDLPEVIQMFMATAPPFRPRLKLKRDEPPLKFRFTEIHMEYKQTGCIYKTIRLYGPENVEIMQEYVFSFPVPFFYSIHPFGLAEIVTEVIASLKKLCAVNEGFLSRLEKTKDDLVSLLRPEPKKQNNLINIWSLYNLHVYDPLRCFQLLKNKPHLDLYLE